MPHVEEIREGSLPKTSPRTGKSSPPLPAGVVPRKAAKPLISKISLFSYTPEQGSDGGMSPGFEPGRG